MADEPRVTYRLRDGSLIAGEYTADVVDQGAIAELTRRIEAMKVALGLHAAIHGCAPGLAKTEQASRSREVPT